MKKVIRQIVGIDVAQKELVVCMGRLYEDFTIELCARKTFTNTRAGFKALEQWAKKLSEPACPVRYVMEATGVYHESLAYFMEDQGCPVTIVLPNKISNYFRTLEVKTVTDKTCSETIARFGLERKLENWKRPKEVFKMLRQLTRERDQIIQERTMVKNQLHAEKTEAGANKNTMIRLRARIRLLDKQEAQTKKEIAALIQQDKEVNQAVKKICSIPGVGAITAATVLAETNGFELIRNRRQLASYAGFDVREKQSGTSVKGKPKISKRGNKYLRKAMHMPALVAKRYDQTFKSTYERLVSRHGIKMKALVAIQRKLLELAYTLYKANSDYERNYSKNDINRAAKKTERRPLMINARLSLQDDLKSPWMQN